MEKLPKRQKIVNFSSNVLEIFEDLHWDTTYFGILVPNFNFFALPPLH